MTVHSREQLVASVHKVSQGRFKVDTSSLVNTNTRLECQCILCSYKWSTSCYHLIYSKSGCPKCSIKTRALRQRADFRVINTGLHSELDSSLISFVDLNDTSYKGIRQHIALHCRVCGYKWSTSISNILINHHKCARCFGNAKYSVEEVNNKLHHILDPLAISFTELESYCGNKQRFTVSHICGNKWTTCVSDVFSQRCGCRKCASKLTAEIQRAPVSEINRILYKSLQPYRISHQELTSYFNRHQRVCLYCELCKHSWSSSVSNILRGHRCPNMCLVVTHYKSKPESEVVAHIQQHYPNLEIQQSVRSLIKSPFTSKALEVDIYIPELKLAFEFNGTYWHSDKMIAKTKKGFTTAKQYHDYKTQACAKQGIRLVHIDESEWVRDTQFTLQLVLQECT